MTTEFRSFWKPERISKGKRKAERVRKLTRAQARQLALKRASNKCERCQRAITDDAWPWADERAHVNEKVPRSLGGSNTDLANLEAICRPCHLPGGQHAPTPERLAQIRARMRTQASTGNEKKLQ